MLVEEHTGNYESNSIHLAILTLSWCRVQTTAKFSNYFFKNFLTFKLLLPYVDSAWKCIEMGTNKPSIGSVFLGVASVIWENIVNFYVEIVASMENIHWKRLPDRYLLVLFLWNPFTIYTKSDLSILCSFHQQHNWLQYGNMWTGGGGGGGGGTDIHKGCTYRDVLH